MSRTRSPLAILSPPTCVDSHAVVMIPRGLPTTKATISAMTSGEANNSGLIDSKCTPGGEQGEDGQGQQCGEWLELVGIAFGTRREFAVHFTRGGQQANQHAGQCGVHACLEHHDPSEDTDDANRDPRHFFFSRTRYAQMAAHTAMPMNQYQA